MVYNLLTCNFNGSTVEKVQIKLISKVITRDDIPQVIFHFFDSFIYEVSDLPF